MTEQKRDLRQVVLSDDGRNVLKSAIAEKFPGFPAVRAHSYQWRRVTEIDQRTVERMLEAGSAVRHSSITRLFADLGIEFDETMLVARPALAELDDAGSVSESNGASSPAPIATLVAAPIEAAPVTLSNGGMAASVRRRTLAIASIAALIVAGALFVIVWAITRQQAAPQRVIVERIEAAHRPARTIVLYDDFRSETSLDPTVWAVNGPAASSFFALEDASAPTIVAPTLSFDPDYGIGLTGVAKTGQQGGIQTVQSFTAPFTVTAECLTMTTSATSLIVGITDAHARAGSAILGGQGVLGQYNGFIYTAAGSGNALWQHMGDLCPIPPEDEVWYTAAIDVDAAGKATMALSSGSRMLGEGNAQVGRGPFYIVLGQAVSGQASAGPNQAYCAALQVIHG